ncbi:phosphomannomutase/phosphoglucomutase [Myxococcota bacterium]|nr:phosphomannomutase/phosphoglucomutase [Myxococcota bacterium]MBU1410118.1 phosphomannomutase/phosphoglucomutase [Myxococcota bacterium]MBU1511893.1 phosphomannomutase/phosphoglucomutase [Myxococcota bacterium]
MASPFRTYDIRGLFPEEVTEELAFSVGRAAGRRFGWEKVCVAHDMRPSSPALAEALVTGLTREGVEVEFLGMTSTDMLYLAVLAHARDGGFMVTASHNPAAYNGIKVVRGLALPVGLDSGLSDLEAWILANRSVSAGRAVSSAAVHRVSFMDEYLRILFDLVPPSTLPPFSVVADSGNGMGGPVFTAAAANLPLTTHLLFPEPDGTFPNHDANPMEPENRRDLEETVVLRQADLGVGFDGDADRAFFVDHAGHFRPADHVLTLLFPQALRARPGAAVVYDVRCSRHVPETILRLGGVPHMGKVGHAHAKPVMHRLGAAIGGELSGHYYIPVLGGIVDSGLLSLLMVLSELGRLETSLDEALHFDRELFASGEINLKVDDSDSVLRRLLNNYRDQGTVSQIDGLRLDAQHYWFSVRTSNTEPLLRLNVEADSSDLLLQVTTRLREEITTG